MLELLEFILSKPSKFFGTLTLLLVIGMVVSDIISKICNTIYSIKVSKNKTNIVKYAIESKDPEIIKSITEE